VPRREGGERKGTIYVIWMHEAEENRKKASVTCGSFVLGAKKGKIERGDSTKITSEGGPKTKMKESSLKLVSSRSDAKTTQHNRQTLRPKNTQREQTQRQKKGRRNLLRLNFGGTLPSAGEGNQGGTRSCHWENQQPKKGRETVGGRAEGRVGEGGKVGGDYAERREKDSMNNQAREERKTHVCGTMPGLRNLKRKEGGKHSPKGFGKGRRGKKSEANKNLNGNH